MSLTKKALIVFAAALSLGTSYVLADTIDVSREDALKAVVTKVLPTYSEIAKQLKLKGAVEVQVSIGEDGSVESVSPVSGNPVLFNCAKDALKKWKFAPFKADSKPVKAKAVLSFTFSPQ